MSEFRESAPSAETVFLRTYSRRKSDGERENFKEAMLRTVDDISEIGKLTQEVYLLQSSPSAFLRRSNPASKWLPGLR